MILVHHFYYQDGADFYDAETGDCLWSAPFKISDFDCDAADRAKTAFVAWAHSQDLTVARES